MAAAIAACLTIGHSNVVVTDDDVQHSVTAAGLYTFLAEVLDASGTRRHLHEHWHEDQRTHASAFTGRRSFGKQQAARLFEECHEKLIPALEDEYGTVTTSLDAKTVFANFQSKRASWIAWQSTSQGKSTVAQRTARHLRLDSVAIPILAVLEMEDRLRGRSFLLGGRTKGGYFSMADVFYFAVIDAYAQHLKDDDSWQSLPNTLRWYVSIRRFLEVPLQSIPLPEVFQETDIITLDRQLATSGYSMTLSWHSEHKGAKMSRRKQRHEELNLLEEESLSRIDVMSFEELCQQRTVSSNLEERIALLFSTDEGKFLDPAAGDLDPSRAKRKRQQLQSLLRAVAAIVIPGQRILEFGAGGGHLGICLASLFPQCKIILLERKMFSLSRALRRIHLLGLSNVEVCIGDVADLSLGNFEFDVGVGLHFCGMLTDLALSACLDRKASFAFVPCCYGKLNYNRAILLDEREDAEEMIRYPRSQKYSEIPLSQYLACASAADIEPGITNGEYDIQSVQAVKSRRYMALIDDDRCSLARVSGYSVSKA